MIYYTATDNENSGKTHACDPHYVQTLCRLMYYKTIWGRDGIQNYHRY